MTFMSTMARYDEPEGQAYPRPCIRGLRYGVEPGRLKLVRHVEKRPGRKRVANLVLAVFLVTEQDFALAPKGNDGDAGSLGQLFGGVRVKAHGRLSVRVVVEQAIVGTEAQRGLVLDPRAHGVEKSRHLDVRIRQA